MASAAERGKKALAVSDYDLAIKEYSRAITESPTSPDFYIQRSTAYLRASKTEQALSDAEQAVLNGVQRAKREAVTEAQLARGKALYKAGRFADALFIFQIVKRREEKHKQVDLWMNKSKLDLSKLPEDDTKRQCSVSEIPAKPVPVQSSTTDASATSNDSTGGTTSKADAGKTATQASTVTPVPAISRQTPADKIQYDYYQSSDNVYVTLFAKGVSKEKVHVEFTPNSCSIDFPLESYGSTYDLTLDPLFAPINTEKSHHRVLPTKVEIILVKTQPGHKWSALESNKPIEAPTKADTPVTAGAQDANVKDAIMADAKAPSYPTSSKSGPKNWDKIGEGEEEEVEGDEANHFFKKLFKGSSPDVQKAMMKSFTESNGTALSTNWEEVSKGKVETLPPDGMEAKEYAK